MQRELGSVQLPIGSEMPKFSLRAANGETIDDRWLQAGRAALVVFTCNHCPYVRGSEDELIEIAREFEQRGLRTVTINANDPVKYPDDSFEKMQEKSRRLALPYPYLHDETQQVAKAFDAACTPEAYLFDGNHKLVFHGSINDTPKAKSPTTRHVLRTALGQLFSGALVDPSFAHPIGCSIKWR